jgi:molecular chaperone DnaJ
MGQGMIVIPCQSCQGQGHVNKTEKINFDIPAGVSTGQVIRLSGKGEFINPNSSPGNLMVEIRAPDQYENFYRKDLNIYSEETVDFVKAVLGREITVKTIYGDKILEIPRGCAPESTLMISGAGVKTSNKRGNHYVKLKVSFPASLSADQEELLVQFEKLENKIA